MHCFSGSIRRPRRPGAMKGIMRLKGGELRYDLEPRRPG